VVLERFGIRRSNRAPFVGMLADTQAAAGSEEGRLMAISGEAPIKGF